MRIPRTLAQFVDAYAAYQERGGALPATAFAVQVGYTLDELLEAEVGAAVRVGAKATPIVLPEDGTVVEVLAPPEAIEVVEAPKPKRRRTSK